MPHIPYRPTLGALVAMPSVLKFTRTGATGLYLAPEQNSGVVVNAAIGTESGVVIAIEIPRRHGIVFAHEGGATLLQHSFPSSPGTRRMRWRFESLAPPVTSPILLTLSARYCDHADCFYRTKLIVVV